MKFPAVSRDVQRSRWTSVLVVLAVLVSLLPGAALAAPPMSGGQASGPDAGWPPAAPSAAEVGKYLVIAMGSDADVGRAFQMSNSEIGADRQVLSTPSDPFGPPTDGGFPNLLDVFGTRWNTSTNPDSINGAATVFQGVDWSGDSALTSSNGKFDFSNSLVFAKIGIQGAASNPVAGAANSYYYPDQSLTRSPLALNNGATGNNNFSALLSELSAWKTYLQGLPADTTISSNSPFQNNPASNGAGGLRTTYTDTNGDGVAVVDVNPGGDFDLTNVDWVISSTNNVPVIFRLRNGSNMVMNNVSILMGSGGMNGNDLGAIFVSMYEGSGSSDSVFNGGSNVILNGIGLWDLNTIGQGGNTEIVINNAQGCAQFIGQKVNFQNNRWNRCAMAMEMPAIDVEKEVSVSGAGGPWVDADSPTGPTITAGGNVYFRFTVTNTGNVALSNVTLSDSDFMPLTGCTVPTTLNAGQSYSCVYGPVTAILGQHENTATATGNYNGNTYTDTDKAHYLGQTPPAPAIDVEKEVSVSGAGGPWVDADSPTGPTITAGGNVYFRFTVTNTGNVALSNVTLIDSDFNLSGCPAIPNPLAASATYTCVYGPVAAMLGQHDNTATATGVYNNTPYQDTDKAHYLGQPAAAPAIDVEKEVSVDDQASWQDADSPTGPAAVVGNSVYFRFRVTNIGNVALSNVQLSDNFFTNLTICSPIANPLPAGASYSCVIGPVTAVAGQHTNTATVTGEYNNVTYQDTDKAHYFGVTPAIDVEKEVSVDNQATWQDADNPTGPTVTAGAAVYFRFRVTNSGDVALSNVALSDTDFDLSGCPVIPNPLAVGATYTCVLGPLPASIGQHKNTATATGEFAGYPVLDRDDAHYNGQPVNPSLGDFVWEDLDADGIQDSGETGIPNVRVNLYTAGGQFLLSTTTDADGKYLFDNLVPGSYRLEFVRPTGYRFSPQDVGGNDALDSDADPTTGQTTVITLAAGVPQLTWDAGLYRPASLGDFVWYDADADGVQDVGEQGIANVTVNLYQGATLVGTTTTGATGAYLFSGLTPGAYSVDIPTAGNPALTGLTPTTGPQSKHPVPTAPIALSSGQAYRDADFGYVRQTSGAIIGNFVWYDGDGDGLQDAGEPGIPGVEVCASPDGGVTKFCATTDATGKYLIEVPPGTYSVAPESGQPELAGLAPTSTVPQTVTVVAGQQYLDADFGYTEDVTPLGAIGDQVWDDTDPNPNTAPDGVFDAANEPGLAGVTVDLIRDLDGNGALDAGEPVIATVSTDGNGQYQFTGLAAGDYLVRVSDTGNVLADYDVVPASPNPGQNNNNQLQPYAVDLGVGEVDLTADFGYFKGGGGGTGGPEGVIGDTVWHDLNGNGLLDAGEPGIPGVTVRLLLDGFLEVGVQTTQADGTYLFTALEPGVYTVQVTDAFGVLSDYIVSRLGLNQGQNGNNQAQPYEIVLGVNEVNLTADFAYVRPATLGDFAWIDTNGDNNYQPGTELPLNGVIIQITDSQGNVVGIQTTGPGGGFAPGQYLQGGLLPGAYTATVVSYPAGFTPSGPTSLTTILTAGEQDLTLDFPFSSTTGVAVISFTAQQRGGQVILKWTTSSEQGNKGFHLYRATAVNGPYKRLTTQLAPSQSVNGGSYRWVDATAQPGVTYWYQLETAPDGVVIGPVAATRGGNLFMPLLLRDR